MANAILNFHFDFLHPSLSINAIISQNVIQNGSYQYNQHTLGIESNLDIFYIHMLKIICPIHLKGQLGTKCAHFLKKASWGPIYG